MRVAFLANGPGEVWGWCRPLIKEASGRNWTVDVHLLPCPFASGREINALSRLPATILRHRTTAGALRCFFSAEKYDAVLQLGGDLFFGRLLAWRQRIPLACYSYGRKKGMKRCEKVLTSRPGLFSSERLEIVGDLVLDSLDPGAPESWRAPQGKRLAIFPGSRSNIRRKAFFFLKDFRSHLLKIDPEIELRVLLSPFSEESESRLWSESGFSVWTGTTPAGIRDADLALTQPGTNTLELMYCKQPFVVAVPFSFLRQMPIAGLVGMLDRIPWFGGALREQIIRKAIPRHIGKMSWPNRLVNESFVPEFIGEYSASRLADEIAEVLRAPEALKTQRERLHELAAAVVPGAPAKICNILERMAADHERERK